jgi:hypothetical protein
LGKSVADGKNLIGGVVGGNSSSTFQVLANNAQSIKTSRDSYASQVSSLNTQLTNMTKDRDSWKSKYSSMESDRNNWMNIANNKPQIDKYELWLTDSYTHIDIPNKTAAYVIFDAYRSDNTLYKTVFGGVMIRDQTCGTYSFCASRDAAYPNFSDRYTTFSVDIRFDCSTSWAVFAYMWVNTNLCYIELKRRQQAGFNVKATLIAI